jgi:hypothetical protein
MAFNRPSSAQRNCCVIPKFEPSDLLGPERATGLPHLDFYRDEDVGCGHPQQHVSITWNLLSRTGAFERPSDVIVTRGHARHSNMSSFRQTWEPVWCSVQTEITVNSHLSERNSWFERCHFSIAGTPTTLSRFVMGISGRDSGHLDLPAMPGRGIAVRIIGREEKQSRGYVGEPT